MNIYNLLSMLDNAKYSSLTVKPDDSNSSLMIKLDNPRAEYNYYDGKITFSNHLGKVIADEPTEIISQGIDSIVYSFGSNNMTFDMMIIQA